jgi:ankyrin repeat protein
MVRLLVKLWPDGMRERDEYGDMPLHSAAEVGRTEMVRLLVEYWPEGKEAPSRDGQTPLSRAMFIESILRP